MITLEQLREMFEGIQTNTEWDTESELLWGYFFTGHEKANLEEVAIELEDQGYGFVEIWFDQETSLYWLHVERVEIHSVETLHRQNEVFYDLARDRGLASYDGMDVGPARPENAGSK